MLWGVEILGLFAQKEEEEADRKAAMFTRRCIPRLVCQIRFAYTFSHRQKEVIHSTISVVKITSRFILCPCAKHTPDTNPTVTHPCTAWTLTPTHGDIPSAALNNLWKWLIMLYLELELNLELQRQSTKPQCWESWNRKHLSAEEARPAPAVRGGTCPSPGSLQRAGAQVILLDFIFSLPCCPGILYIHDSAVHAPPGPYMPDRNRKMAVNEKAQGSYSGVPSTKSLFSMGKWFWRLAVVMDRSWGFQVGCKEIQSAMNGSSVYYRQWEKWFSWNPWGLEGPWMKLELFRVYFPEVQRT